MKKLSSACKKYLTFTKKDIWKELLRLCKEGKVSTKKFSLWKMCGGLSYTIEKIASDIYLSDVKILQSNRTQLKILAKISNTDLLSLNDDIKNNESNKKDWMYDYHKKDLEKKRNEILKQLNG